MYPRKSDNDAERLERVRALLQQLHAEGERTIAKSGEVRHQAERLLRKARQKPKGLTRQRGRKPDVLSSTRRAITSRRLPGEE